MPWLWLFTALLILTPALSWSHPSRTAADGCRFCRTNCARWGEVAGARHCHGGEARPNRPPPPPFQPRRGVDRPSPVLHTTGYARIIDGDTMHIGAKHPGRAPDGSLQKAQVFTIGRRSARSPCHPLGRQV